MDNRQNSPIIFPRRSSRVIPSPFIMEQRVMSFSKTDQLPIDGDESTFKTYSRSTASGSSRKGGKQEQFERRRALRDGCLTSVFDTGGNPFGHLHARRSSTARRDGFDVPRAMRELVSQLPARPEPPYVSSAPAEERNSAFFLPLYSRQTTFLLVAAGSSREGRTYAPLSRLSR